MTLYPGLLTFCALMGAACAGFILAQSPSRRATQLAALLGLAGSWWALCEAFWNSAATAAAAAHWMRLSAPGWAFLPGLLPHLVDRYFDEYPMSELGRARRLLGGAAVFGYAIGLGVLVCALAGWGVHGEPVRVSWGWAYSPGPVQLAYLAVSGLPSTLALVTIARGLRSPMSVAPTVQRTMIRVGVAIPLVLIVGTEMTLPVLGVHFPRLGGVAYSLFGLAALVCALRYGLSFFTPNHFSREILETIHEGVVMVAPGGAIRQANRGFGVLSGCAPEEVVGRPLHDFLARRISDDPELVDEVAGELRGPGGQAVPVSISSAPLHDQVGNAMGRVVVLRDLREIEELRRRMLTQARLAAVGELAAGLAHEINNPLAFVRTNLGQLAQRWDELCSDALSAGEREDAARDGREMIQESLVGTDRAVEVVRGVRRFTHAGFAIRELADANELIEDILTMLRCESRPDAVVFRPGRIPLLPCEPQQLRQVFLNLVANALHASRDGGRVEVSTQRRGDHVVVEVADRGVGMDAMTLERIFDPFFTTKEVGEGTGLGLAISWHIVSAHGGEIDVRSAPGEGSSFRVRLPIKGSGDPPAIDPPPAG